MRKNLLFGIVVAGLMMALCLSGCGEREEVEKVDLSKKRIEPPEAATESEGAIRIAVGAMISPRKTFTYYQSLLDYISRKLDQPVTLVQRRTYEEVNDLLRTRECGMRVHLQWPLCPGPSGFWGGTPCSARG